MAQETAGSPHGLLDWRWMLPGGPPAAGLGLAPRVGAAALVAAAGRLLVGAGVVLLLFAGYQLWGTGLVEAQAQRALTRQLEQSVAAAAPVAATPVTGADPGATSATPGTTSPPEAAGGAGAARAIGAALAAGATVGPPGAAADEAATALPAGQDPVTRALAPPPEGAAIGRLELPTIGVTKTVVEGVGRETLRTGPGRYPSSALPGGGNVAIAGHRTTHGAPFADLDRLQPDDEIHFDTPTGRFTYRVLAQPTGDGDVRGHRIVDPAAVEVIADHGDDRLTLTACHPKFSARQRIVVAAVLVDRPVTNGAAVVDPARSSGLSPVAAAAPEVPAGASSAAPLETSSPDSIGASSARPVPPAPGPPILSTEQVAAPTAPIAAGRTEPGPARSAPTAAGRTDSVTGPVPAPAPSPGGTVAAPEPTAGALATDGGPTDSLGWQPAAA
ncbi:MAG: sortase, partial [Actinomycetota bacterium]